MKDPLLETLRGVPEVAHDPLDRVLHAVEVGERVVELDGPAIGPQSRHGSDLEHLDMPEGPKHPLLAIERL